MEVPDVPAHAEVLAEIDDQPAADVPAEIVVVRFQKSAHRDLGVRS